MCDMAEKVSCSAVITSEYSKLFSHVGLVPKDSMLDVPNANYGILFYIALLFLNIFAIRIPYAKTLILLAALASGALSVVLLYIMIVILQDICVVCMCTHVCNATILAVAVLDFKEVPLSHSSHVKSKKS
jgi:vitamin-K-epoxide reductase (warfarin-sensitive)